MATNGRAGSNTFEIDASSTNQLGCLPIRGITRANCWKKQGNYMHFSDVAVGRGRNGTMPLNNLMNNDKINNNKFTFASKREITVNLT